MRCDFGRCGGASGGGAGRASPGRAGVRPASRRVDRSGRASDPREFSSLGDLAKMHRTGVGCDKHPMDRCPIRRMSDAHVPPLARRLLSFCVGVANADRRTLVVDTSRSLRAGTSRVRGSRSGHAGGRRRLQLGHTRQEEGEREGTGKAQARTEAYAVRRADQHPSAGAPCGRAWSGCGGDKQSASSCGA